MDPVSVLVVDDEHNILDSMESILGSDYAVMRADNGDAAVAIFHEESDQIELVILDLGFRVCRATRRSRRCRLSIPTW
ncbi:MAG: hypothetical protein VX733_07335 [Candidatus Latescibacterota bacterium]|nr:hypothetical protein [Candidatus Latescibacterota bacterium]